MNKPRIYLSPALVVSGVALLVVTVSVVSSLSRRIGLVEPHVWIRTAAAEKESVETLSRTRALENTMNGEVSHSAVRLREASAVATVAALCAVTNKANGHQIQTVEQLLSKLKQENLLPPGLDMGSQSGTLLSSNGLLYLRYRLVPLGIEVVSVGVQKSDGPALIVRIPDDGQSGAQGAAVYIAEKLEGVVIPYSFAPASEVVACGWERQRFPEAITN